MQVFTRARGPMVLTSVLVSGALLTGCAGARAGPRPDGLQPGGTVLTRNQIEDMHVRTALEAVERGARHLTIQRTREGTPVRIYSRGVDSFVIDADVQVVIDGSLVNHGVDALNNLLVQHIEFIQILSGREAVLKYGTSGGNGAIIVKTTAGLEGPASSIVPQPGILFNRLGAQLFPDRTI